MSILVSFYGAHHVYDPFARHNSNHIHGSSGLGRHHVKVYKVYGGASSAPASDYYYEVSLTMRDLQNGQVVYETYASHQGPWSDAEPIMATLFNAALNNFPNPPAGEHQVQMELPH